MKRCYGYIRVSTVKQGERGVSLQEQRSAIERYAARSNLQIIEWFEERETAAKQGRPLFDQMLKLLRAEKADGVVIHKIDRSARNLKDWANLGTLIDSGISVHFANESVDLQSRGGRLSADIQAVVAADYIRNLREEALKGLRGRLRQGIYPFAAPLGYLDNGGGKVKTIDPARGPLVRRAFELYAHGGYTLDTLVVELERLGLHTKTGNRICRTLLSRIFNNPFYAGVIRVSTTGETYQGRHDPLLPMTLFKAVQNRLAGRTRAVHWKHDFLFRGLFRCSLCGRHLAGEKQRGHVYYRCHGRNCETKGFREEALETAVLQALPRLGATEEDRQRLTLLLQGITSSGREQAASRRRNLEMRLEAVAGRHDRLVDAFVDGGLDKPSFDARKQTLLEERQMLQEQLASDSNEETGACLPTELLDLAFSFHHTYDVANSRERRELLLRLTSTRSVAGRRVLIELHPVLQTIATRPSA